MHAADLAKRLNITQQRVHQLAVSLHALGLVRFGDQGTRFSLIARKDDPTALLCKDEERILSAISDAYPTLQLPRATANALFQYLKRRSLVRKSAQELHAPYELTEEGCQVLAELARRRAA